METQQQARDQSKNERKKVQKKKKIIFEKYEQIRVMKIYEIIYFTNLQPSAFEISVAYPAADNLKNVI